MILLYDIYAYQLFAFQQIVIVEKITHGGFCSQSDQCTNSTVCICTCKQGFVFINSDCQESKKIFHSDFFI